MVVEVLNSALGVCFVDEFCIFLEAHPRINIIPKAIVSVLVATISSSIERRQAFELGRVGSGVGIRGDGCIIVRNIAG